MDLGKMGDDFEDVTEHMLDEHDQRQKGKEK
jgi:hypothetical protein